MMHGVKVCVRHTQLTGCSRLNSLRQRLVIFFCSNFCTIVIGLLSRIFAQVTHFCIGRASSRGNFQSMPLDLIFQLMFGVSMFTMLQLVEVRNSFQLCEVLRLEPCFNYYIKMRNRLKSSISLVFDDLRYQPTLQT